MTKKAFAIIALQILLISLACAQRPAEILTQARRLYITSDYNQALEMLAFQLTQTRDYQTKALFSIEIGDIYLDKLNNFAKAESTYQAVIRDYPKYRDIASVIYRLGIAFERQERFLDAAQAYERVATKYLKSSYADDGLDAIERCFKKNYQELVAKVDEFPITRLEFDDRVAQAPSRYEKFEDKEKLLDDMINERLFYLEAMKQNIEDNPEIALRLSEMRNNTLFQDWISSEVMEKVKVTEREQKGYYRKNKKTLYTTPEQVRAREILVSTLDEAKSLRARIVAESLPFDSVAKETSLAPNKKSGGDMGYFQKGTHPKPIEGIAFRLKPGETSRPIQAKDGFVLLKIEDKKPTEVRTYDQVAKQIESALRQEKMEKQFKKVTEQLKKKYKASTDTIALSQNQETLGMVDGSPITNQELQESIARIPPFYRQQLLETPEGKKRILEQIVLEQMLLREIEEDKLWLRNKFIAQFEPRKVSTITSVLRRQETSDKVKIDTIEMKKDYRATIKDFKVPEQIRAREIVVKTYDQAAQLRKQALTGKISFDSLAKQYSITGTRWQGGDVGYFSHGSKPKEIENVIFNLSKGQLTRVIKLNDTTYTILKVQDKRKAYTRPFNEVKEKIERKLRGQKEEEMNQQFIAALREKVKIEKFLTEEPPMLEEPEEPMPEPEEKE